MNPIDTDCCVTVALAPKIQVMRHNIPGMRKCAHTSLGTWCMHVDETAGDSSVVLVKPKYRDCSVNAPMR